MGTDRWEIDSAHSSLHFSVRHLVIAKVRGSFARWSGTIHVPNGDFSKATVTATIDASSINTGVADRDGHLKSPDFFDVAQYPDLRFEGKRVQPRSDAEIGVMARVVQALARRSLMPRSWHSTAAGELLLVDLQIAGLTDNDGALLAAALAQIVGVEEVLTARVALRDAA